MTSSNAFFAARAFRASPSPVEQVAAGPAKSALEQVRALPVASASSEAVRPVAAAVSGRTQAAPRVGAPSAPKPAVSREIAFRSLMPQFGVKVAVDGEPRADAEVGGHITLDGQQHLLTFTCAQDACEPKDRVVPSGDAPMELEIALSIKPASLLVQGESGTSYTIQEQPTAMLRSGIPARVPMKGAKTSVHVVELPSGRSEQVTLLAGQQVEVTFTPAPEAP